MGPPYRKPSIGTTGRSGEVSPIRRRDPHRAQKDDVSPVALRPLLQFFLHAPFHDQSRAERNSDAFEVLLCQEGQRVAVDFRRGEVGSEPFRPQALQPAAHAGGEGHVRPGGGHW
eukprot:Polyplicarium_translucidae@DN228_c0_g1_i1.p2